MKIFNKLASALMVLPMVAALTACSEKDDYTPGSSDQSYYDIPRFVYFASSTLSNTAFELVEAENSFEVTLERDSIAGELTVQLTSEQTETVAPLTIPTTVTFPDSVKTVTINVGYDAAAILAKGGTNDTVSIKIANNDSFKADYFNSEYKFVATLFPMTPWCATPAEFVAGGGQGDFPLTKTQDQVEAASGTYTYTQYWSGDDPNLPVLFRQNTQNPKKAQFRIENVCYGVSMLLNAEFDGKIWHLDVPELYTGYDHSSYGPLYTSCTVNYGIKRTAEGASGWNVAWDDAPSYYDPAEGLFTLNLCYYVSAGYFGYGNEYFQVNGFKPYEANLASDFQWKAELDGEFNSAKLGTKSPCVLYKGVCVNNTDNCDSTFAATYGTAYKLEAPYAEKNDLYFCLSPDGNIIPAPGVDALQPTGLTALDQAVFAKINTKASSFVGKKLILNISFVNKDESMDYGTTNEIFSAASWISLGMATYTDGIVAGVFDVAAPTYEVEIFENEATPGIYRMKYPYGEIYPYNEEGDWDDSKSYDITINAEDPTSVYIEEQPLGIDYGYGMMYVISNAARYLASGYSIEVIKANNIEFGTLEDGVITFPVKGLLLFMGDGGYYANNDGEFKLVLPQANGVKALAKANFTGKQTVNHKLASKSSVKKATSHKVNWKGRYVGNRQSRMTPKMER